MYVEIYNNFTKKGKYNKRVGNIDNNVNIYKFDWFKIGSSDKNISKKGKI